MLINSIVYEDGKRVAQIAPDEISDYLGRPGSFLWVALKDASADELASMQAEFGLHPLAVEDASHGHQRPKLEEYGETLFCVIQLLERDDDDIRVGEVAIFVHPQFALSVRSGSRVDFLGVRERCEHEPDMLRQGTGFVFYALLDHAVDGYFPLLDGLEGELDRIESRIFEKNAARDNIQRLYALKRKSMTVRNAVLPMLEFMGKLHGGRVPPVCQHTQEYFRDVNDHLARLATRLESIREAISTAIQVNLAMVGIEESEITKKLAAWASIFAASTALAGIWGMNFDVMPELRWRWGYPAALSLIALVSLVLFRRFRRAGWI